MSTIRENPSIVNGLAAQARALRAMGYTVIGVARQHKRPATPWEAYQAGDRAEEALAETLAALAAGRADRIGLVCGPRGLVCLDLDATDGQASTREALEALQAALGLPPDYPWAGASHSGRGSHLWLTVPDLPADETRIVRPPRRAGDFAQLEVRAWRHYTALPRRDGRCDYGAPLDRPPAAVPWADLLAAIEAVCAPPPAPPAPPGHAGNGHAGNGHATRAAACFSALP